ncbi:MAG TPA: J domain-containing protein [Caulobacteraceae bacterium]|jgi:curved DNA-binding protein CbpA
MSRTPSFVTSEDPAYYAVLGVATDARQEEIAAAYRALMRRYHPDAAGGGEAAEEVAKQINEAFSVLGHPELRAQYDAVHGYPRVSEAGPPADEAPPPKRKPRPPRWPATPPAEEHGAPAMLVVAALIAAAAVFLVALLVALAREQRAEIGAAAAPEGQVQEPRQR